MFEQLKNLAGVMGQAKEFKARLDQVQAELARKTVEADAGAGAVRVVVNGKLEVLAVRVDRAMLMTLAGSGEQADQAMVEELIAAAVNAALVKARDMIQREMMRLTGGMNVPGLEKLLGG